MSLDSARKFFERFKEDEGFRARIESCNSRELRTSIIKEAGYDFTEDEIREVMNRPVELDIDDLDAVAGGVGMRHNSAEKEEENDGAATAAAAIV